MKKRNWLVWVCLIVVLAAFWGWRERKFIERYPPENPAWNGEALGTFYSVKLVGSRLTNEGLERLKTAIDAEFEAVERSMSVFREDSDISIFNRAPVNASVPVDKEFAGLLKRALEISDMTGGAFDPTVGPLVELWGFGRDGRHAHTPTDERIQAVRGKTGWQKLSVSKDGVLTKNLDGLMLDLGAIAKGYVVDRLAVAIRGAGIGNFMVEVGGEVYASGRNSTGLAWKIGVDSPLLNAAPGKRLVGIVSLSDRAVATSGNYRNFFKGENGTLYSHIIDPRTGFPVQMRQTGVSVIASDCATADALATALFVLGEKDGLALIDKIDGVEALFVISGYGVCFREATSSGFYETVNYEHLDSKGQTL